MWYVIAALAIATVAVVVAVVMKTRASRPGAPAENAAPEAAPEAPAAAPMTGLESALAQVTDRDGRPIRDHIDAETQHVDDLRVPDDTGPLLRRALDHVEHHDGPDGSTAAG